MRADAAQLERVFSNLIENAVRHSPPAPPVRVSAAEHGGRVTVRVVDRGRGIPAAQRARVFEPFFRGRRGRGSGLGLAICRGFVEANGGQIVAGDRTRSGGASIAVSLPVAPQPAAGAGAVSGAAGAGRRRRAADRPRAEGDPARPTATRWRPRPRPGGGAGAALAARPPDVVLLDLVLPDGSGVEICRELRSWSRVPVVVLSAVGDEREKVRALDAGADDYVTKPFSDRGAARPAARRAAPHRRRGAATPAGADRRDRRSTSPTGGSPAAERRSTSRRAEFDLLRTLARHRGRLVTHRQLLQEVWGPAVRHRDALPAGARGPHPGQARGRSRSARAT